MGFLSCSGEDTNGTTGGGGTPGATVTETFTGYGTSASSYLDGTWDRTGAMDLYQGKERIKRSMVMRFVSVMKLALFFQQRYLMEFLH